jgi:hypothetical protein
MHVEQGNDILRVQLIFQRDIKEGVQRVFAAFAGNLDYRLAC